MSVIEAVRITCAYSGFGLPETEDSFRNNMRNGFSRTYYPRGELWTDATYENDKLEGITTEYYENGKMKSIETYSDGKIISKQEYDTNGNPKPE